MTTPPVPNFPTTSRGKSPISWSEVGRCCRRICLLEERGERDAADALRAGALAEAIRAVCTMAGEAMEVIERQVAAMMDVERERVANASVLAELLAPLLRDAGIAGASVSSSRPVALAAVPAMASTPAPRAAPANIADFIDEMLAQERDTSRSATRRRAS